MNAAAIALGMQAEVLLLDRNIDKLRQADRIYQGHLQTVASNGYEVERPASTPTWSSAPVLVPGAKAPTLVSNELVSRMRPGSVLVGHLHRPGWLLRGLRPDDARRPTYPGAHSSSTASRTCRAPCRTPRRTR
jgi:alanine dehydrogenase